MESKVSPVKEVREKIGVSQRELADAFGVHHTLIANLEMNLIDISGDDEELQRKVHKVFTQLANHTGIPKEELIKKQAECTKQKEASTLNDVQEKIRVAIESISSLKVIKDQEEYIVFLESIKEACGVEYEDYEFDNKGYAHSILVRHLKSPLKVFRDEGGITQREMAQATGVSQTLIARVELGEMPLSGMLKERFTDLIYVGLGAVEYNKNQIEELGEDDADYFGYKELQHVLHECQELYIFYITQMNRKKVENAFKTFKKKESDKQTYVDMKKRIFSDEDTTIF